jgi:urease gamma subunit
MGVMRESYACIVLVAAKVPEYVWNGRTGTELLRWVNDINTKEKVMELVLTAHGDGFFVVRGQKWRLE